MWKSDGDEVITTITRNGISTTTTKRESVEHCDLCDAVIDEKSEMPDLQVWIDYDHCESDVYSFCSYVCLSQWAAVQYQKQKGR